MLMKSGQEVPAFIAGDGTWLKELLHPQRDGVNLPYSLAEAVLSGREASLPHVLESNETYFVLNGSGTLFLNGTPYPLESGDLVLVPAGTEQYLVNTTERPLRFLCIVDPPWTAEGEKVFHSVK